MLEKLADLRNDPLALEAGFLRKQATDEALHYKQLASDICTPPLEAAKYDQQYALQCKEAGALKDNVIQDIRNLFGASSTPKGTKSIMASVQGLVKSFYDLGKGLVVDIPVFLYQLGLDTPQWKEKLKDKWNNLGAFCEALFDQTKQSWEDSEAYRVRMQMVKEVEDRMELYRMVFDAENYHLPERRVLGYLSAEMIQFFFGG